MIKIMYKECCQNCGNLDIDYETDEIHIMTGEKQISAFIGCSHMPVCKRYIDEKKMPATPELSKVDINAVKWKNEKESLP